MLAAFKRVGLLLAFGLTIVGLAWNEPVCLNVNGIRVKNLE